MGQQIGPMIFQMGGTLVGSYLGGPIGGAIGGMIGGIVGGLLFRAKKPLITDTQSMNSTYGNPIPLLYGTARLPGVMIWQTKIQRSGGTGKGMPGPPSSHQSAALAFCEGPARCVKIYLDGKLFWDSTSPTPHELTKHTFMIRGYEGTEDQLPDYQIAVWCADFVDVGIMGTPAYRGLAYFVMDRINLEYYGGRFPQVTAVYTSNGESTTFFHPTIPFTPDVTGSTNPMGGGMGVAVDWTRGVVYQLSSDESLRAYSTTTYQCLLAKPVTELLNSGATLIADPDYAVPLHGVVCGSGGNVFVWGRKETGPFSSQSTIYELDPNTFEVLKVMSIPCDGEIWSVVCWTTPITQAGGTGDMLACSLYNGSGDVYACIVVPSFYMDPATVPQAKPTWFVHLPGQYGSGTSSLRYTTFGIGTPDPITATTTLYTLNTGWIAGFDNAPQYFSSFSVAGATITPNFGPVQIKAETFGLAPPTSGGFTAPMRMIVDPADGNVVFFEVPWFPGTQQPVTVKIVPDSQTVVWTARNSPNLSALTGDLVNTEAGAGTFAGFNNTGAGFPVLNLETGTFSYSPISIEDAGIYCSGGYGAIGARSCSAVGAMIYSNGGAPIIVKLKGVTISGVSVASILLDLCNRVGVTADMVDVSLVTQTIDGYVVRDNKAAGSAIAEICNIFLIDMVETDYVLKFVPRGRPSVATITQDHLASIDGTDPSHFWMAVEAQEQEMPLQINLKYLDPALDYQPGSAYFRRTALPVPTVWSKRKLTMDIPAIVNNQVATGLAAAMLYSTWAARETYDTSLGPQYLWLDPTDNITVNLDNGDSYTVRIESIETGADLTLKLHTAGEDITVYEPITATGVTYGNGGQVITPSGFATLLPLNLPLLQDSDAAAPGASRIYYAALASLAGWNGGNVDKSTDGVNWNEIGTLASGSNYGTAVTALPDVVAKFATDRVNSVRVSFAPGSSLPHSCAYSELMNGANAAVIGQEVIQFQTVVDNADGTVTLSDIIRSRRGTDWATGLHTAGETVLLLQPGLVVGNVVTTGEIGVSELWRLVPLGLEPSQAQARNFTPRGYDLFPYAPVHFARAAAGSDLVATWVRRTRIGGLLVDGSDTAPLAEDAEAYDAYILPSAGALATFDPANSATYTRAFATLTSATLTYTAAMMTADSFTPATSTLYLVVYQRSGVVGRGFRGYQALPAF
jgi:hypothetical protein